MPALDYPEQDYYPRAKLRLIIRFEEFNRPLLIPKVPTATTKILDGVLVPRNNLIVQSDPNAPSGVKRFVLTRGGQQGSGAGQDQNGSSDNLTHVLAGIIPKTADWNMNGIKQASTLNASIKYIDCPLDPRTIRSCAIEYLLGTVSAEEYAAGIAGKTRGDVFGSGVPNAAEPMDMIPDTYIGQDGRQRTNLRFQGWVDTWTVDFGKGEPMIQFECRDNTSLLIEQEQPAQLKLEMELPLDQCILQYLSHFTQLQGISVEYRPAGDKPPILKEILSHTQFVPNLGPPVAKGGGSSGKHSVWDYLTEICAVVGHRCFLEGTVLVISRTRTLTTSAQVNRIDDPFQGRSAPDGTSWNYRRFIYGRNIETIKTKRHWGAHKSQNIELRSYNPENKQNLVARFPSRADRLAFAIPGDAQPDEKWMTIQTGPVKDQATLNAMAQEYYEQVGRPELEVEIKLRNVSSFGGGNLDPDVLDTKFGDTIEILTNRDDAYNTLTQIEKNLTAQQRNAQFMQVLGFDDDFAQAYAAAYTDPGLQTIFKLRTGKFHFDTSSGISINLNCVNYVEIRADKVLPSSGTTGEPNVQRNAPTPPTVDGPKPPPPPDDPPPPNVPPTTQRSDVVAKLKAQGYSEAQAQAEADAQFGFNGGNQ